MVLSHTPFLKGVSILMDNDGDELPETVVILNEGVGVNHNTCTISFPIVGVILKLLLGQLYGRGWS